jgi:hypothetical protein
MRAKIKTLLPQAAPMPKEADTVRRNLEIIYQAISPALASCDGFVISLTISPM